MRAYNNIVLISILLFSCVAFILPDIASAQNAQDIQTVEYINSVFYNKRLKVVRSGFDRWQNLINEYYPGKSATAFNDGIYSAVYDFNYGKDTEKDKVYPQMVGAGVGTDWVGVYFMGYTTDIANFFRDKEEYTAGDYRAGTAGINLNLKYIAFQGDVTYTKTGTEPTREPEYYGKVSIPFIKTSGGAGYSKYKLLTDPVTDKESIVESDKLSANMFDFSTSFFRFFNLGFRYYKLLEARYMPNISLSLHQFLQPDDWGDLQWDFDLFFESRSKELDESYKPKDYDVRLVIYRLFGSGYVNKQSVNEEGEIGAFSVKPCWFLGISYKSKENEFVNTLTESGMVYTGEHGFGCELGVGMRILGFKSLGFDEDTYVKFSGFYNYSEYFERFPAMEWGLKFRVIY